MWEENIEVTAHCYFNTATDATSLEVRRESVYLWTAVKILQLLKEARCICLNAYFQNYSTHTWRNFLYILPSSPSAFAICLDTCEVFWTKAMPYKSHFAMERALCQGDRWQNWTPRRAALFWQHADGAREQGTSTQVRELRCHWVAQHLLPVTDKDRAINGESW